MKEHSLKKICLFFLCSLALSVTAAADTVTFSSDKMKGKAGNSGTTVLSGNAKVNSSEINLQGDSIELTGTNFNKITALGSVTGKSVKSKFEFSADKVFYNRDEKVVEFFGSVKLVDSENDTTITSDYAKYSENSEILTLKFNITITQKEKKCSAIFATYNRKTSLVDLTGKPQVVNGSDTFNAERILINLNTEEITLQGKVSGNLIQKD